MSEAAKKLELISNEKFNFHEVEFFKIFPQYFLQSLKSHAEFEFLEKGKVLLSQGQMNKNLYFLVDGEVVVEVDDEIVVTLQTKGDLLGEMSAIMGEPCSATLRSLTDLVVCRISNRSLSVVAEDNEMEFYSCLYKTYSQILSDKLRFTNLKARRFEIANRELNKTKKDLEIINRELENKVEKRTIDLFRKNQELEQQNTELFASHKKLEDLYSTRDMTFARLNTLYKNHLMPLKSNIENLKKVDEVTLRQGLSEAHHELNLALQMIKPVTQLYSLEQGLKKKKVLFADKVKKQQIIAKMAFGGTGVDFDVASDIEEAKGLLELKKYDIIFITEESIELATLVKSDDQQTRLVLIMSSVITEYIPIMKAHPQITNVVSRNEEDRNLTVKNLVTTVSKIVNQDWFGIEKYLMWGVDVHTQIVKSSEERRSLIDLMKEDFIELGVRSRILDRCALGAEELLMNAIYDAPVDDHGKSKYNHLGRNKVIHLEEHERAEFRYACDGIWAAISVTDPFGAFRFDTLLNYLDTCYSGLGGSLNQNKGGAGRGLHQTVENSDLTIFNVKKGQKTEVIVLFSLEVQKNKSVSYPSFHFFFD